MRRRPPVKTAPAPWAVEIADVNRDGKLDLVIIPYECDGETRGGAANVTVLLGNGSGGSLRSLLLRSCLVPAFNLQPLRSPISR